MRAPEGFLLERLPGGAFLAAVESADAARRAGLTAPDGWERLLQGAADGPGRGRLARAVLPDGRRVVLKKLKRGGATAALWRDRLFATRALANLETPLQAAARGIATPAPVALLLRSGPPGLVQAWLATEEIAGSEDLLGRFRRTPPADPSLVVAVLDFVRRTHDLGLVHRDLNLGNLLVRERAGGGLELFVVDLDRATLSGGPLGFRARLWALRRLERSAVKNFGWAGPAGAGPAGSWYDVYARIDPALAKRFSRKRRAGRLWLAFHHLGWRDSVGAQPAGQRRDLR